MLVQCHSDVPISLACSMRSTLVLSTAPPEPRPVGTSKAHDQAGSSLDVVSSAGMKHRNIKAEVGVIHPHSVQDHGDASRKCNHCAFGTTTARKFRGHVARPRRIMTVAAWHRVRQKVTSRALVIPPVMSRSLDWLREGVGPTHGLTFLEDVNRPGSSTADRYVSATAAPTPGSDISRQQTGSSWRVGGHGVQGPPALAGVRLHRIFK